MSDGRRAEPIDCGRAIDWSRTSADYAAHRPGPPQRLFEVLAALGIGRPAQRVLDLGTGTGLVARELARRGAMVTGIDIAPGQIEAARRSAEDEGLAVDFFVAAAEASPFADASFEVAIASQCWMYFDVERTLAELRRVLTSDGLLVTTHFSWLPRADPIARASEALVLAANPQWQGGDWSGAIASEPTWAARPSEGRGDVLVRRRRAVHARELARPHARLSRRRRDTGRARGRRVRRRARGLARRARAAGLYDPAPGRRPPAEAVAPGRGLARLTRYRRAAKGFSAGADGSPSIAGDFRHDPPPVPRRSLRLWPRAAARFGAARCRRQGRAAQALRRRMEAAPARPRPTMCCATKAPNTPGSSPLNGEHRKGRFDCRRLRAAAVHLGYQVRERHRLAELLRLDPRRGSDEDRPAR